MDETPKPALDAQATNIPPAKFGTGNTNTNTGRPNGLRPWKPGQSGNPAGRPKVEPRVRKLARKYDRRMVKVLASIAEDPKVSPTERRRAAMDLIAIGSGRPATTQELVGRPDSPLVQVNVGATPDNPLRVTSATEAAAAYARVIRGEIDVDAVKFEAPALAALPAPPFAEPEQPAGDQDEQPNNVRADL